MYCVYAFEDYVLIYIRVRFMYVRVLIALFVFDCLGLNCMLLGSSSVFVAATCIATQSGSLEFQCAADT